MPDRIFFFSDIDDTLIQTRRKTDSQKEHSVAGYNQAGEESSYIYSGVKLFVQSLLDANITFVPTTARNIDSYRRTLFYQEFRHKYAILNFGGTILIDDQEDKAWQEKMQNAYETLLPLDEIMERLETTLEAQKLDLVCKIIDGYYISLYNKAFLDHPEVIGTIRETLIDFLTSFEGFYLYENDNSFGILPHFLNKKFAVAYLIEKHQPLLTIGAGDNHSDLDFMNLTSFAFVPHGSRIHKKLCES